VARIYCAALENGETEKEIRQAIKETGCSEDDDCEKTRESLKRWQLAGGALAAALAFLIKRNILLRNAIELAKRLAATKAFKELMERIQKNIDENIKEYEDLLRRINESDVVLPN
jgi:predicted transcriptional regulator